jgi:hypothetical protein
MQVMNLLKEFGLQRIKEDETIKDIDKKNKLSIHDASIHLG